MVVYYKPNKKLFADTVSANKKLFADSGVPIEKKHIKGRGLLYGGFYLQIGICKYLFICS